MNYPWWHRLLVKLDLAEPPCGHKWRPAVSGRVTAAARYCDICERIEVLTHPEFYAQFGRMPW